ADRLDIVAVRIEHEGTVVIGVIMRAKAGRAIVGAAGRQRGGIEGVDLGVAGGSDGVVATGAGGQGVAQPEIGLGPAIAAHLVATGELLGNEIEQRDAEWGEGRVVKRLRAGPVGNGNADMVDHVGKLLWLMPPVERMGAPCFVSRALTASLPISSGVR